MAASMGCRIVRTLGGDWANVKRTDRWTDVRSGSISDELLNVSDVGKRRGSISSPLHRVLPLRCLVTGRPVHELELQAVGIGEEDRVVAGAIGRAVGRRIEDGGADAEQQRM